MRASPRGLAASRGFHAAAPALELFDVIALAEAEAHLEYANVVHTDNAQETTELGRNTAGRVVARVVHPAATIRGPARAGRFEENLGATTVTHPSAVPRSGGHAPRGARR